MEEPRCILDLPAHITLIILDHLPLRDKEALGQTHRNFLNIIRSSVRKICSAFALTSAELQMLAESLMLNSNVDTLALAWFPKGKYSDPFDPFTENTSIRDLRLLFDEFKPSLVISLASAFQSLRSLELTSTNEEPFNMHGELSVLSNLENLESLAVKSLCSDEGLQHLTKLRTISITYPDYEDIIPPALLCVSCSKLHIDDETDLLIYYDAVEDLDVAVIGANIAKLPLLEDLTMDLSVKLDKQSPAAVLNRAIMYEWQADDYEFEPSEYNYDDGPWFSSLKRLTLKNASGPGHFFWLPGAEGFIQDHDPWDMAGFMPHRFWYCCSIWSIFKAFPTLKEYSIDISGVDDEFVPGDSHFFPFSCLGPGVAREAGYKEYSPDVIGSTQTGLLGKKVRDKDGDLCLKIVRPKYVDDERAMPPCLRD